MDEEFCCFELRKHNKAGEAAALSGAEVKDPRATCEGKPAVEEVEPYKQHDKAIDSVARLKKEHEKPYAEYAKEDKPTIISKACDLAQCERRGKTL